MSKKAKECYKNFLKVRKFADYLESILTIFNDLDNEGVIAFEQLLEKEISFVVNEILEVPDYCEFFNDAQIGNKFISDLIFSIAYFGDLPFGKLRRELLKLKRAHCENLEYTDSKE